MRATIRSVAEEAGVSAVTVSNVLRGLESRASAETRERVLDAARKLNYMPISPPTSQNRRVETRIVSVVPEHEDITQYDLDLFTYKGIVQGARQYGYDVLTLVRTDRDWGLDREELRFLDRRSDGFIFAVSTQGQWEKSLEIVAQHRIPSVVCYCRETPHGVPWVDVDNVSAMQQVTQYLVAQGHRRIAYLAGPEDNFNERQRRSSWVEAMEHQGLGESKSFVVQGAGEDYDLHPQALNSILHFQVTAVVCFNDTLALALWEAATEYGLSIPRDLSIFGLDNRPEAAEKGLSSVAHSFVDVGRLAMEAWVELQNGTDAVKCCKIAPVELVPRQSVRDLK